MKTADGQRRFGGLLFLLGGALALLGCASTSDEVSGQQQNMAREIAALRADFNTMQRETQTRLLTLERETKTAIDHTKEKDREKERSATSSRKLEADTAELKRAVDRYADKTKQMLASLIQAFVDAANEMQIDNPQARTQETPTHPSEQRSMEPREPRQEQRFMEPGHEPRSMEPRQEPRSFDPRTR